jgi:hypothetical protein
MASIDRVNLPVLILVVTSFGRQSEGFTDLINAMSKALIESCVTNANYSLLYLDNINHIEEWYAIRGGVLLYQSLETTDRIVGM